jgi:hypothetical protein
VLTRGPVESIQPLAHLLGEGLQAAHDGAQDRGFGDRGSCRLDHLLCLVDLLSDALRARGKLLERQGAGFVGIEQALEDALLGGEPALRLCLLGAGIGHGPVGLHSAPPLLFEPLRLLQHLTQGRPDLCVQLLASHARVGACARDVPAQRGPIATSVVAVGHSALGTLAGPAAEGVSADPAPDEPLQQKGLPLRPAERQSLVASELLLCSGEEVGGDERGHLDRDPPLGRRSPVRAMGSGRGAPRASRAPRLCLGGLGLSVRCLPHGCRVFEHGADRRRGPARPGAGRDASLVEPLRDRVQRHLLIHEGVEDLAHHLRLRQHDVEARRRRVRAAQVTVTVRCRRQRVDVAAAGLMQLAAAAPLGEPCPLVLGDHALDLDQQRVLGILPGGVLQEDDLDAARLELLEQQDLISVASGQPIGAVDVESIDTSFRDPIA